MLKGKTIRRIIFIVIKVLVFGLSAWYIYYRFSQREGFESFRVGFNGWSGIVIALVFLLMLLNWSLEAIKWQLLISKLEHIRFLKSFKAVLTGITINHWIPNRLAEFAGRIVYLQSDNRKSAVFSTLAGGYSQFVVSTLFGTIALLIWVWGIHPLSWLLLLAAMATLNVLLVLSLLNIRIFNHIIEKIGFLKRYWEYIDVLRSYKKHELARLLGISALRYLVYSVQYYLLLLVFNTDLSILEGFTCIPLIFLVQGVIPTVTLTEIGIRGAAVLYFAGRYSANLSGMLTAAYGIWLINVIIPGLAGAFMLLSIKRHNKA